MSYSILNEVHGAICSWRYMLTAFVIVVASASISTFVIRGTYNRYFHPLKDAPFPFWNSVTDLSQLSVLSCPDLTAFSLELHHKYGMSSC